MNCEDYKTARNLAWKTLLYGNVCKLPVRASILCRAMGITLAYGDHKYGGDGYCTIVNGSMYIVVRKGLPITYTRFTVAHEMGHLLLGHVGECHLINQKQPPGDNPLEQAANTFAFQLLAPTCVLWGCGVHTTKDIATLCEISLQSAKICSEQMALPQEEADLATFSLAGQIYKQFLPFIYSHRQDAPNYPEIL